MCFLTGGIAVAGKPAIPLEFNEAPELRRRVAAGELPPVWERLPETPLVVGPGTLIAREKLDWQVGKYGGTLTGATTGAQDGELRDAVVEYLIAAPWGELGPRRGVVAEHFEVDDDNQVFTFRLRKGLRWSDGAPVTTEDVGFAFEILTDDRINPIGLPPHLRAGGRTDGQPMQLEIIDEFTFRLTSAEPYGAFGSLPYAEIIKPKHYLKKFHAGYSPLAEIRPYLRAEELGDDEWPRLLNAKDLSWLEMTGKQAVDYPVLGPWMRVASPAGRIVMVRNPYYFKVDTAGNQLPYIDRYESILVADAKIIPMLVISGSVNLLRVNANLQDLPLYAESARQGKFRLVTNLPRHNPPWALFLNLTNPDESWRRVVNDIRFRRALDLLIPRQQIVDDLYLGMGRPSPWTPGEYNPRKATALLDEMGMNRRDRQGYRLAPDGKWFSIRFELVPHSEDLVPAAELIIEELRDVGIRTEMKIVSYGLRQVRIQANALYASLDFLDTGHWERLAVLDFLPDARAQYGPLWAEWMRTGGARGEEPPDWAKDGYAVHRQAYRVRPDGTDANQVVKRLRSWMHTNLPMFPLTHDVPNLVIIPPNLGNFAHAGMAQAATYAAEQFFFTE